MASSSFNEGCSVGLPFHVSQFRHLYKLQDRIRKYSNLLSADQYSRRAEHTMRSTHRMNQTNSKPKRRAENSRPKNQPSFSQPWRNTLLSPSLLRFFTMHDTRVVLSIGFCNEHQKIAKGNLQTMAINTTCRRKVNLSRACCRPRAKQPASTHW